MLFFSCSCFKNRVIRYVLKQIYVMFQTNFGYVLSEIYPKDAIDRRNQFQEKGERGKIYMVTYIEISINLVLLN